MSLFFLLDGCGHFLFVFALVFLQKGIIETLAEKLQFVLLNQGMKSDFYMRL